MDYYFKESDPSPKGKESMPNHDAHETAKIHDTLADELKLRAENTNLSTKGNVYDLRK